MCRSTESAAVAAGSAIRDDLTPMVADELQDINFQYKACDPVGDPLQIDKEPHLTRFLFQNPDGFGLGHELEQTLEPPIGNN